MEEQKDLLKQSPTKVTKNQEASKDSNFLSSYYKGNHAKQLRPKNDVISELNQNITSPQINVIQDALKDAQKESKLEKPRKKVGMLKIREYTDQFIKNKNKWEQMIAKKIEDGEKNLQGVLELLTNSGTFDKDALVDAIKEISKIDQKQTPLWNYTEEIIETFVCMYVQLLNSQNQEFEEKIEEMEEIKNIALRENEDYKQKIEQLQSEIQNLYSNNTKKQSIEEAYKNIEQGKIDIKVENEILQENVIQAQQQCQQYQIQLRMAQNLIKEHGLNIKIQDQAIHKNTPETSNVQQCQPKIEIPQLNLGGVIPNAIDKIQDRLNFMVHKEQAQDFESTEREQSKSQNLQQLQDIQNDMKTLSQNLYADYYAKMSAQSTSNRLLTQLSSKSSQLSSKQIN